MPQEMLVEDRMVGNVVTSQEYSSWCYDLVLEFLLALRFMIKCCLWLVLVVLVQLIVLVWIVRENTYYFFGNISGST